jgi:hypothetical protein
MCGTSAGRAVVCAAFLAAVFAAPAYPQSTGDEGVSRPAVEVTPFVSLGSERASRIGAAIAFAWTNAISLEAEMGFRHGEGGLRFLDSSLSLLYHLPQVWRVTPYLAAGAGLQEYGVAVTTPHGGLFTLPTTAITVNAGGGVKVPVTDRVGFRSDARWVNGFGRGAGEHWRVYNGMTVGVGTRTAAP